MRRMRVELFCFKGDSGSLKQRSVNLGGLLVGLWGCGTVVSTYFSGDSLEYRAVVKHLEVK